MSALFFGLGGTIIALVVIALLLTLAALLCGFPRDKAKEGMVASLGMLLFGVSLLIGGWVAQVLS
ncbi:hypothetical protein [Elioraea sp.]|uniref:hypothetical protein n=1 Tax=Elioraea sp. TaxID=2185103 RepID=UPI0025BB9A8D|nr:hypothetical protein [Elioraea sp.]